jgi:hypothetical protein
MENVKNLTNAINLLLAAKTIKGTSFVGLRNYENKQGEKSNQTIIAGITYENCLVSFNTLQVNKENVYETLSKKYNNVILDKHLDEVYESLEKSSPN